MKLQPDKSDVQTLTAHGPGWVAINNERVERSVVLGSRGERFVWDCASFDDLGPGKVGITKGYAEDNGLQVGSTIDPAFQGTGELDIEVRAGASQPSTIAPDR